MGHAKPEEAGPAAPRIDAAVQTSDVRWRLLTSRVMRHTRERLARQRANATIGRLAARCEALTRELASCRTTATAAAAVGVTSGVQHQVVPALPTAAECSPRQEDRGNPIFLCRRCGADGRTLLYDAAHHRLVPLPPTAGRAGEQSAGTRALACDLEEHHAASDLRRLTERVAAAVPRSSRDNGPVVAAATARQRCPTPPLRDKCAPPISALSVRNMLNGHEAAPPMRASHAHCRRQHFHKPQKSERQRRGVSQLHRAHAALPELRIAVNRSVPQPHPPAPVRQVSPQ